MEINEVLQQRLSRRNVLQRAAGGLMLAGLAGPLAACGSDDDGGGAAAAVESVTISAWYDNPLLERATQQLVDAFHEANPSITVDMAAKPGAQFATLLKTALVGGTAPDVLSVIGAGNARDTRGYMRPIGDKLDISQLTAVARNAVVFDDDVWGCPLDAYSFAVIYHRPVFREHGIEPPKSWDDLIAACRTLQDAGVTPFAMPAQDVLLPFGAYMLAVNSVLGADALELLASGQRKLTDPDLVAAAQLLVDLQPYYNKGFAAVPYAEGKALFAQGRAAMIVGGSGDYPSFVDMNPDADLGAFGFPSPDGDKQVTLSATNMVYTVNKKTKHVPQVEAFIKWIATPDAQQIVADRLGLPTIRGVSKSGSGEDARFAKEMIAAGNPDTIQWTESTALIGTFTAASRSLGLFTGSLDAEAFASNIQRAIVVA